MGRKLSVWLFVVFAGALAAFQVYAIVRGVSAGAVASLHKSGAVVGWTANPGAFALNLGLRALIALVLAAWGAVLVRDQLRARGGQ